MQMQDDERCGRREIPFAFLGDCGLDLGSTVLEEKKELTRTQKRFARDKDLKRKGEIFYSSIGPLSSLCTRNHAHLAAMLQSQQDQISILLAQQQQLMKQNEYVMNQNQEVRMLLCQAMGIM